MTVNRSDFQGKPYKAAMDAGDLIMGFDPSSNEGVFVTPGDSLGGGGGGDGSAVSTTVTPAGTIAATNVQAALEELDGDIVAHVGDSSAAHAASAISFAAAGTIAATTVQAAIAEVATDAAAALAASTNSVAANLYLYDNFI